MSFHSQVTMFRPLNLNLRIWRASLIWPKTGMLRLGKQPSHGFFPVLLPLRQSLVGYGATGAGISHDLGAVDGYVAELHQFRFLAQPQRLYEQAGKRVSNNG